MTPTDLRINDLFWTFQGEGAQWGRRALFVRMPFCNLACSWCDTQFNSYKTWTRDEFTKFAVSEPSRFAVVTGGEPMINRQTPAVIDLLRNLKFEIACESNGTFPVLPGIDYVTVSPKRDAGYEIHDDNWFNVHEFKYVVDEGFDWSILKRHEHAPSDVRLSLSPEFGRLEQSLQEIFAYIKENPRWRISLQTHKFMKIP